MVYYKLWKYIYIWLLAITLLNYAKVDMEVVTVVTDASYQNVYFLQFLRMFSFRVLHFLLNGAP